MIYVGLTVVILPPKIQVDCFKNYLLFQKHCVLLLGLILINKF